VTYACRTVSGPAPAGALVSNLCTASILSPSTTYSAFNSTTGSLSFWTADKTKFPPGVYVVEIAASAS